MHPYLVCATPRSGSTLLCELLSSTGVAGRPEEYFEHLYHSGLPRQPREYFEGIANPAVLDHLAPSQAGTPESAEGWEARLQNALEAGRTPNGVWASKMMWGYLLDFLRRLKEREATARLRAHDAIETVLPGVQYVHVRRRDKVGQAVSLWTAVQTAQWREEETDAGGAHEPVYSHAGIMHLLDQLRGQDDAWTQWFSASGITPHVVWYEDLVEDRRRVILDTLRELQIDTFGVEIDEPKMRRQSGGRSAEWVERFESERKAASV